MKFWRLAKAFWKSIPRTFVVWQMNEASRAGKTLYSCTNCGMARTSPCEHWLKTLGEVRWSDWLRTFFKQWLWEMIRWPGDWREHFQGTCFRCMHYKSQHVAYENGYVKCAAEGECCDCHYIRAKRKPYGED